MSKAPELKVVCFGITPSEDLRKEIPRAEFRHGRTEEIITAINTSGTSVLVGSMFSRCDRVEEIRGKVDKPFRVVKVNHHGTPGFTIETVEPENR